MMKEQIALSRLMLSASTLRRFYCNEPNCSYCSYWVNQLKSSRKYLINFLENCLYDEGLRYLHEDS